MATVFPFPRSVEDAHGQTLRVVVSEHREDWDRAAWDEYVTRAPAASLYHRACIRDVIEQVYGHRTCYLSALDAAGAVAGVLPLVYMRSRMFGRFLVSLPFFNHGGPVASSPEAERRLEEVAVDLARTLDAEHLELRCATANGCPWPARTDKVGMVRALPDSEDALWSELGGKLRAQIRRPWKAGATALLGGAERLPEFYTVFARNMRDLGTPVYPRAFFDSLAEHLGADLSVAVVRLGGRPVAAGVLLRHRSSLEIPWASSLRETNRLGTNMLLYWTCLRSAVAMGCDRFDFGRSSPDSGTYRFKRQWGARPVPFRWYVWSRGGGQPAPLNPSNPKYRLAVRAWQRLPLWLANRLGPAIVRNIP